MAYVISISNGKGGVAKTTSCIALGSSLAKMGYRVLLIDLDPNANLTLGLGTLPAQPVGFSKDLFLSADGHSVKCSKTGYKNLDIIPSNQEMASLDGNSPSNSNSSKQLKGAMRALPLERYDFVVIDCPPSISYLTINALVASNLLIIPTQSEFFSAYVLQTMFSILEDIRKVNNPELSYKVLVTLLDLRLREHSKILNQLQKHLENCLFKTRIQVDTSFRESQTQGIPITYFMPNSRGALQYNKLAQEILNDITKEGRDRNFSSHTGSTLDRKINPSQNIQGNSSSTKQIGDITTNDPVKNKNTREQVPIIITKNHEISQQLGIKKYCSFLGGADDSQTAVSYPTSWNKCYRSKPALSPNPGHQASHCLTHNYLSCTMLRDESQLILPSGIRSPLDVSEALQYFKSWLETKTQ